MTEFKIIKTEEKNNRLSVHIEINKKVDSFAFPLNDLELHPKTNKPIFIHRIKEILDRKYNPKKNKKTKKSLKQFINLTHDTSEIEDLSKKALFQIRKKKDQLKGDKCAEKLNMAAWAEVDLALRLKRDKIREDKDIVKRTRQLGEIENKAKFKKHCEDGTCNM